MGKTNKSIIEEYQEYQRKNEEKNKIPSFKMYEGPHYIRRLSGQVVDGGTGGVQVAGNGTVGNEVVGGETVGNVPVLAPPTVLPQQTGNKNTVGGGVVDGGTGGSGVVVGGTGDGGTGDSGTGGSKSESELLANANIDLTRPLSQIELARTNMEQARQKVYDVLNRKFTYNAKESPLYTILQQQYEKEARIAAGKAYARSVANTGGYGSSYATMAASEAGRQAMEGFNDQQLALYQAAKEEFLSERQSAVDWYNQMKLMYGDAQDEATAAALDAAYTMWDGNNEDAVRQALLDAGVSAEQVNTIIQTLSTNKLKKLATDSEIKDYQYKEDYGKAYDIAAGIWKGDNEDEVRAALVAEGVDATLISTILSDLNEKTYEDEKVTMGREEIRNTRAYNEALTKALGLLGSMSIEEIEAELSGDTDAATVAEVIKTLKENKLVGMEYESAFADATYNQQWTNATMKAYELWSDGYSLDDIRTELEKDTPAAVIVDVLSQMKEAGLEGLTDGGDPEVIVEATQYLQTTYGTTYSEGAMRNDLQGKGYSEDEINAALESQRKFAAAVIADYNPSTVSDAIANASTLKQAFANKIFTVEEYDAQIKKNCKIIMENVNAAMENLNDADYKALGITDAEWDSMEDSDKKLAIFDAVGQLVKEDVVTSTAYFKMLYNDLEKEFSSKAFKESDTKVRDVADAAVVIKDLYDNDYLLKDEYINLTYNVIAPEIVETEFFKSVQNAVKMFRENYGEDEKLHFNHMALYGIGNHRTDKEWKKMGDDEKEVIVLMADFLRQKKGIINNPKSTAGKGGQWKNENREISIF